MKQKLLFALLALFTGWGSASAQTDVTATYLTNAGFDNCTAETSDVAAKTIKDYSSVGWTNAQTGSFSTIAVTAYGNNVKVGNSTTPSTKKDGTTVSGNTLGIIAGWSDGVTIQSDDVTLPAGIYTLTVDHYLTSGNNNYNNNSSTFGFVTSSNSYLVSSTTFSASTWTTETVTFTLSESTTGKIQIGLKGTNSNGSGAPAVFYDDITLEYTAWTDYSSTNPLDMTSWIVNPSFELNTFNGTLAEGSSTGNSGGTINKPTGWTCFFNVEGWRDCSSNTTNPADGTYCMNSWFGTIREQKFYQTIDNLPEGIYEISAQVRTDQTETTGIYTYGLVGGTTYKSDPWDATKADATWNSMANWQTLTARATIIGGGSLQFGLRSDKFVQFDDFHLTYLGTDLLLTEVIAAWNTAHNNLAALDATLLPDAAETAITTELAKACPSTQAEIEAATAAMQALIDSYPGIKAAYDEYKALKAKVEDLKNTSKYTFTGDAAVTTLTNTLSSIDTDAEAATDAATLTALLPDLRTAGNTFVSSISSNDGFDLTYNIENNSFETGTLSPWTTNGSNDTGVKPNSNGTYTTTGVDGAYLFNTWNNGAGSKVSQTLSSLPKGYYTVTALVASNAGNSINILAGATTKTITIEVDPRNNDADPDNNVEEKSIFIEGTTDKVLVSNGSLEIGTNSSTWYKTDNFRLTFYTETAGAAEAWAAAKAAAEAALANSDYANVSGSEKTELQAEIAKAEPTTAEAYGTATTALQEKTATFIAAKDSYDGLVAMRTTGGTYTTTDWPRAAAAKKTALDEAIVAEPTDAADAVTKTNAIVTAYRQFVESNGLAEGVATAVDKTSLLLVSDANVSTSGWTSGSIGTNQGQAYTMGDGNQPAKYFDGGWASNAGVDITLTQELTLPAGQYQLQITARGAEKLTSYTMSVGTTSVDLPHIGGSNGTFGNGWSDKFITFESDGTTQTLTIAATSTESQQWISFNRLRLIKLDATLADATDYSNLNTAIAAAEAKLGFEDGEYAPYNNVGALTKLAEAKAIDQTANNVKEDVQALTTYLNTTTNWTANTGEVNAVFNGMFNSDVDGDWGLTGWTRTNNWGQQQTGVSGDYATAYYNQPGSLKYGETGVYTMPLKANTTYLLRFAYRSHENNSNQGVTVSVLNGTDGISNQSFPANGSTSEWKKVALGFTTGEAGNYVLTLANGGNTWMTAVELFKAQPASITIKANRQYTGFSCDKPLDFTGTGLTAQIVTSATGTTQTVTKVPAYTGVIVGLDAVTSTQQVISVPVCAGATDDVAGNMLVPVLTATTIQQTANGNTNYVFGKAYDKEQFFKVNSNGMEVPANNVYLAVPTNAAKGLDVIGFGGDATSINALETETVNGNIYNLQGQKVNRAQKGIYIVNGRKVVVK